MSWTLLVISVAGCASIPKDRYGVEDLDFQGVERMDTRALAACLATHERSAFQLNVGRTADPVCGEPPFDASRLRLRLWHWPWTDWPLYDSAVFERDLDRIERWYRARGFYDARVVSTRFDPPAAATNDEVQGKGDEAPCERLDDDEGCAVDVTVEVEEGEPVLVDEAHIHGSRQLPSRVRNQLRNTLLLREGDRFDEALYDQSERMLEKRLRNASYACADVEGEVHVYPEERRAHVHFTIDPGPRTVFGDIQIVGNEDLPKAPIRGAAYLEPGDPYSDAAIEDAQRAVYDLGSFSSVEVEPLIPEEGCTPVVDVRVKVTPARRMRFGFGAGIQSGTLYDATELGDVRQWDVHLLGLFEHRNLFGGMQQLRIEERPRLIFSNIFPQTDNPQLGNQAIVQFRQPGFLEPRTTLVASGRWDLGPEPFGDRFFRHDLDARIGLQRSFLDGLVFLSGGIHGNLFIVTDNRVQPQGGTRDYHLMFWEQYVQLDLRDDPRHPRKGAYFRLGLQEAGFGLPASWDYVRTTPEARGYVPLPLGMVLAARFSVGAIFIVHADPGLERLSRKVGPEQYRLRGGGANSNRGFIPGDLGAGIEGGRRRWESSLELRANLTESIGIAFFGDVGDVSRTSSFRFDHLNLSVGGGLRYRTPVGPLRLDIGWQVPGMNVVNGPDPDPRFKVNLGFTKFVGAVHITIGESF